MSPTNLIVPTSLFIKDEQPPTTPVIAVAAEPVQEGKAHMSRSNRKKQKKAAQAAAKEAREEAREETKEEEKNNSSSHTNSAAAASHNVATPVQPLTRELKKAREKRYKEIINLLIVPSCPKGTTRGLIGNIYNLLEENKSYSKDDIKIIIRRHFSKHMDCFNLSK